MKIRSLTPGWRAVLIVVITLIAYIPAMKAGFIWDDDTLLTANPLIKAGDGWWRVWVTKEMPYYFPLTWMSFWVEWRLWEMNAAGYHVTNILLHALGSVLLWRVLERLKVPGAWLAGLLFAVHPVAVESVAWIAERKNTLSLVFYLASWLLYLRFETEQRRQVYGWSLVVFGLALLSKSTVAVLPVVLLLSAWWQRGKWERRDWVRVAPFFALALALGLVTLRVQSHVTLPLDDRPKHIQRGGLAQARAVSAAVWFYLGKAVWPVNLMAYYPHSPPVFAPWVKPAKTLALATVVGVLWWKRRSWARPWAAAGAYYLVALLPAVGLWNVLTPGLPPRADHLQYLALIGVVALAAGLGTRGWERWRTFSSPWIAGSVAALIVATLAILTWRRCEVYRTPVTYWTDAARRHPVSPRPVYNRGAAWLELGQFAEAEADFREAIRIRPNHQLAHLNLANLLVRRGQNAEAREHYATAIALNPKEPVFHLNLAKALAGQGNWEEAVTHYEAAARLQSSEVANAGLTRELAAARYNYGVQLGRRSEWSKASEQFRAALKVQPDHAAAQYNLAVALLQQKKVGEALPHLREAVRLNPRDADARALLDELQKLGQP